MEDQDPTLMLPKHAAPPLEGATDSQMQNLMAAGAGAFAMQQAMTPTRGWQPPTLEQLQQALPQYEITAFIARGGMGAVYRGTQRALKRAVAIKVLPPEIEDGDMQFAARFKHEAQAMAQLSHPNIVAVFDAGEVDGLLYFVMEFIEGTDLAQLIASEGRIEPKRAIQITGAVCEALAFAHEEGIIHRDIKPSNIMIDRRGRVKVADFGLAKTLHLDSTLLTGTNLAMGTPDFIAPEALMPGVTMDGRADLYAVGVMLYQMLTGAIPRGRFALPSSVIPQMDKAFDAIVDKAMQTDRENRYSTATEMRTALADASLTKSTAVPLSMPAAMKPRKSRTPMLFGISIGVVILAAGTFLALKRPQPGPVPPVDAPSEAKSPATAQGIAVSPRLGELKLALTANSPTRPPPAFSLDQWHQLFTAEKEDVWARLSRYENGLLFVKATVGLKKSMPSTADGVIRAVVRIKTETDYPILFGRFRVDEGYYQASWNVKDSVVGLSYYGIGSQKDYKQLISRALPDNMPMRVGDVVKLELRLEGDRLIALTNGTSTLEFRHDKLKGVGEWGIKSLDGAWFESVEIEPIPPPAQGVAASPGPGALKPAMTANSPTRNPSAFSLEQWHQLLPVEKPEAWERLSSYEDGLLYVKANVGFRRSMPSTADGVIRAVVRIKTETDNPMLIGRFRSDEGYYQALWDVKSSMVNLSYYAIGSQKDYKVLIGRKLPTEMTMRVGDELRLELRLEGDRLIALTNETFMIEFHHDKLKTPGEWGIKSLNGAWFESAEIEPIPSP